MEMKSLQMQEKQFYLNGEILKCSIFEKSSSLLVGVENGFGPNFATKDTSRMKVLPELCKEEI